ncbi:GNAT family N-acetyltransferase [Formosa algae]|uniref:GNAT superfamily N-acetyltransferase n=1 Tax=Formosa algae TaxID=225843 RepID=A0A9X0YLB5_9FLAO|nr:GNAT family N-acetyltransferase [Formosa algae]MBP1839337.1 GNAT superfamily N-acetyltransferase [Formosa algae]MDQ0334641.1 GNAT superfamily N-acetyltransferase [Formosa algae]OEI81325.1 hypothetical protein AST99_05015 [Formosa algae]PNW27738.1 hypothetical protein BKP44_11135 [Formosa algae]
MQLIQDQDSIVIKIIKAQDTYAVRHPVLRPGRPIEDCVFDNDEHPNTFHLGLFLNTMLVGVVTYMKTKKDEFTSEEQYQLRGMAVLENYQGLQFGKLLVNKGEAIIKEKHGDLIWLNAREIALHFYNKCGYEIIGDPFNIPKVGKHYMMFKNLH